MKQVTIQELIEITDRHPNYTIDIEENTTDRNYYNVHDDIIGNMVEWNVANFQFVLESVVNVFDETGEYIETYQIKDNTSDLDELKYICDNWDR